MKKMTRFLKIDLLQLSGIKFFIILPVLFSLLTLRKPESFSSYMGLYYSLFSGLIIASLPFEGEKKAERGFLQMLPTKGPERIQSHFLFGFLLEIFFFLEGYLSMALVHFIRPGIPLLPLNGKGGTLLFLGISLLFIALQDLSWTCLRFQNTTAQVIVRLLPPFIFFFGLLFLRDNDREGILPLQEALDSVPAVLFFLVSIVIFYLISLLASHISMKKGQA